MHDVVDIEASVAAFARQWAGGDGHPIKLAEDLDRYARIIDRDRPDLVIETGTWTGASARWFAARGLEVVTIDINPTLGDLPGITQVVGSSIDPVTLERVAAIADGRRVMVSLDSDHSAAHVTAEIVAYSQFVTPGCCLVVEDGICRWIGTGEDPLAAVEDTLPGWPDWRRDTDIEALHPVTMHPAGWWQKKEVP